MPGAAAGLDWTKAQDWTFEPVDNAAFPAIELARTAGLAGGCAPAVFNAANEELVAAFHSGRCGFLAIVDTAGDGAGAAGWPPSTPRPATRATSPTSRRRRAWARRPRGGRLA